MTPTCSCEITGSVCCSVRLCAMLHSTSHILAEKKIIILEKRSSSCEKIFTPGFEGPPLARYFLLPARCLGGAVVGRLLR